MERSFSSAVLFEGAMLLRCEMQCRLKRALIWVAQRRLDIDVFLVSMARSSTIASVPEVEAARRVAVAVERGRHFDTCKRSL